MSSAPCYNGPNPVKDDERPVIWKWAKANGIDQGLPYEKVHDAINQHFFAGQAKPEWIHDILGGRKTPFRQEAANAWRAQYNRRMIVQQAKDLYTRQSMNPLARAMDTAISIPRDITVGKLGKLDIGHGAAFPLTHAGDLSARPQSWGVWFKGMFDTWTKMWDPAKTERALTSMERRPLFELALRSGVDVKATSQPSGYFGRDLQGPSGRAWDMMKVLRYNLWENEVMNAIKPGMSQAEIESIGKEMAPWANHATGSGKGPIASMGPVWFGPKLFQSKINRLTVDPYKTLKTFANWNNATAGEKAVAWTRSSGLVQYALTPLAFLAVNQGFLMATNSKQKINFTDPTKSDYLTYKVGGLEFSFPGLHSEIRNLAQVLATAYATNKELHGDSRQRHAAGIMGQYVMSKATPLAQRAEELLFQEDYLGRPVPWSSNPGTDKKPRMSWGEYLASIGPIPLSGPIKYFYDHLRNDRGSSALDAATITKGLIIYGMAFPGLHVGEDYSQEAKVPLRTRHNRSQISK